MAKKKKAKKGISLVVNNGKAQARANNRTIANYIRLVINNKGHYLGIKRHEFMDVIEGLPEKERLVMSLHCYEDFDLEDIARILESNMFRINQLFDNSVRILRQKFPQLVA